MKKILILLGIFFGLRGVTLAQEDIPGKMPTMKTELTLIPDSIVIRAKNGTSYIIVTNGNGYITKDAKLFRKIVEHMASDSPVDGLDKFVLIEGTSIGALSKFYRTEFKGAPLVDKKRAMELNGNLYRLTGYKLGSTPTPIIQPTTGTTTTTTALPPPAGVVPPSAPPPPNANY